MQTTSTTFQNYASGQVRPLSIQFRMSFDKAYDDTVEFFTLDQSILDGPDLLQTNDPVPMQAWNFYDYKNYTDRIISAEWSREIDFPYSVSSALADVKLNNYDNYFSPNSGSPIQNYIIPKRPMRILSGFKNEVIPQFVGLTEKIPTIDDESKIVTFHATDFLSEMFTLNTTKLLTMQNVRTDQVLEAIFDQFGLSSSMYDLDEGANIIPFLFYEKGTATATIFNSLMEAEMGNLWLDEAGIIRFSNRYQAQSSPTFTFDESSIVSISVPDKDNIINKVKITSKIRELQEEQSIWNMAENSGSELIIKANSTAVYDVSLDNPCVAVINPTIGQSTTTSWFTAIKTLDDSAVTTDISVTGQSLKTNTITFFFANDNNFEVNVNAMELWGEPAKIVDVIDYEEEMPNSIAKYGERLLEIKNDFIQSISQCQSLAIPILLYMSEYANTIDIEVKSQPAIQLNDAIEIYYAPYSGVYRVQKIVNQISNKKYTQKITCSKYASLNIFTLDESILDGTDVLDI